MKTCEEKFIKRKLWWVILIKKEILIIQIIFYRKKGIYFIKSYELIVYYFHNEKIPKKWFWRNWVYKK